MDQVVQDCRAEQLYVFDDKNDRLIAADSLSLQNLLYAEKGLFAEYRIILRLRLNTIRVDFIKIIVLILADFGEFASYCSRCSFNRCRSSPYALMICTTCMPKSFEHLLVGIGLAVSLLIMTRF